MKKKLLYLIPIIVIGIIIGLIFNTNKDSKTSLSFLDIKLASYPEVQENDNNVEGTNMVKFDAYFAVDKDNDGIVDKIRGNTVEIGKTAQLSLDLTVTGGVSLKDAKIEIVGNNVKSYVVESISEIESGVNKSYKTAIYDELTNDISSYSAINKIVLTGTVNDEGTLIPITKEVEFVMDWYRTELSTGLSGYSKVYKNNSTITVDYEIESLLRDGRLAKSANYEIIIPELNGVKPTSVTVEGTNYSYNYDENTSVLTISREAVLNGTVITNSAYDSYSPDIAYNNFSITTEYPIAAGLKDSTIYLTANVWYELYNNQSSEYQNVLTSSKRKKMISTFVTLQEQEQTSINQHGPIPYLFSTITSVNMSPDKGLDKTPVLNKIDGSVGDDKVQYYSELRTSIYYTLGEINKVFIYDNNYDSFDGSESLANYVKYVSIKFTDAITSLGENGYIILYDGDTNEVIHVFTNDDWNNTYTFEQDVRKIYIETSSIVGVNPVECYDEYECSRQYSHILTTNVVKELDNTLLANNFTKEQIESYRYIMSDINTDCESTRNSRTYNQNDPNNTWGSIGYYLPQSTVININGPSSVTTGEETNLKLRVYSTYNSDAIVNDWKDGEFLVVIPKDFIAFDINNVTSESVNIIGYELEDKDDYKILRIITSNDVRTPVSVSIDADVFVDPRMTDSSLKFEVYAINKGSKLSSMTSQDKYDVNNNGDTTELVNYNSKSVGVSIPNLVRTITVFKIRDNNGNERMITSPQIAEVNPLTDDEHATIEMSLINRSNEDIKDIAIIGKLGYEGNTYVLRNTDLNSRFDVLMASQGITIPNNIINNTTVYYSDVENPSKDINDVNNNWKLKENITDFSSIKSYLIVIDNYTMEVGEFLTFSYDVTIPMNTNLINKTSYVTDAAYYTRITANGLTNAEPIEPKKTGIMMTRKYDLTLTNYQINSTKTISESSYVLTDSNGQTRLLRTDANGNYVINDLYVGELYSLVQTKVKYPFELDENVKTFKVINNAFDYLELSNNETGTYKNISITDTLLTIDLENELRYDLTLTNKDLKTNELIPRTKYKITGKGYETGEIFTTGENGEIDLKGLYLYNEYTIEQVFSGDYMKIQEPFTFTLGRSPLNNEVQIMSNIVLTSAEEYGDAVALNDTNGFSYSNGIYNTKSRTVANGIDEGYIELDLTNYLDTYMFEYYVRKDYYARNVNGFYHKVFVVTDINHIPDIAEKETLYYDSDEGTFTTAYNYNSLTDSFEQVPITGGRKYYIYMYGKHPNNSTNGYISFIFRQLMKLDYSTIDIIYERTHEKNNILYEAQDDSSLEVPKMNVTVKLNKKPTYTLELTKVSADTKEPLKGAQYKISGDSIPAQGKYITTDENGKATVELNAEWILTPDLNSYNYPVLLNGYDYSSVNGLYAIKEVVPPVGYQIDNTEVKYTVRKNLTPSGCSSSSNYYECQVDDNTPSYYALEYSNVEKQFVEYEFDEQTNTLKVVMYDYPLVSVVKKDGETGDVLPNTLFAVYSVEESANGEVLTPAKDSKGQIIGTPVVIDNETYYVLTTDKNGKFNLDLINGKYKVVEIQASDDKYEVDNTGSYFSVGPTIEGEEGTGYYDSFEVGMFRLHSIQESYHTIVSTSDGGYIVSTCSVLTNTTHCRNKDLIIKKLSKDYDVEWEYHPQPFSYAGMDVYTYYDKPAIVVNREYSDPSNPVYPNEQGGYDNVDLQNIIEVEDGYVIEYFAGAISKINKNGQLMWMSKGSARGANEVIYYTAACDKQTRKLVDFSNQFLAEHQGEFPAFDPNDPYQDRDENTYYCSTSSYYDPYTGDYRYYEHQSSTITLNMGLTRYIGSNIVTDKDGNIYFAGASGSPQPFLLADGTYIDYNNIVYRYGELMNGQTCTRKIEVPDDPEHPENGTHYENRTDSSYCYRGDYFYPYTREGVAESDVTNYFNYTGKHNLLKLDKDGNLVDVRDLGIYYVRAVQEYGIGNAGISFTSQNPTYAINIFENGDLLVLNVYSGFLRLRWNETNGYYDIIYYIPTDFGDYMWPAKAIIPDIRIEGNEFYITKATGYNVHHYDENGILIEDICINCNVFGSDYNMNNPPGNLKSYYKLDDDRYLVFLTKYNNSNERSTPTIQLTNGESVQVELGKNSDDSYANRLTVFEMNSTGDINWVKQYDGLAYAQYNDAYGSWVNPTVSADGSKIILPTLNKKAITIKNVQNDAEYVTKGNMYVFKLADAHGASFPESYSIEVPNNRKVFKININSGVNGSTEVVNGSNVVQTVNNEEKSIEDVKYGDDSIYTIKAKGTDGYYVDKVLVNGDEYPYSVNEDGSITLDKFDDVRDNKNVVITFKPGNSIVIVHHYKKDTTEKIASDELLSGNVDEKYNTSPAYNRLYTLITDENGDSIFPDNQSGVFKSTPIVVTYYYNPNMVDLRVNYYVNNTTIELSPSTITQSLLGSSYKTTPKTIQSYKLVNVIGDEEGTLDRASTEITYMYQETDDVIIRVKYVDKDTKESLIDDVIMYVKKYASYETPEANISGYELQSKTDNYKGIAESDEIEVIYYYAKPEVKPEEENPKTGDNILMYIVLLILSTIGLTFIKIRNRQDI